MSVEFAQQLILLIVSALVSAVLLVIRGWAKEKWGIDTLIRIDKELENKESIAYRAIWLAEDLIKGPGRGPERLEAATKWAATQMQLKGINITEKEVQEIIRAVFGEIADQVMEIREDLQSY